MRETPEQFQALADIDAMAYDGRLEQANVRATLEVARSIYTLCALIEPLVTPRMRLATPDEIKGAGA